MASAGTAVGPLDNAHSEPGPVGRGLTAPGASQRDASSDTLTPASGAVIRNKAFHLWEVDGQTLIQQHQVAVVVHGRQIACIPRTPARAWSGSRFDAP